MQAVPLVWAVLALLTATIAWGSMFLVAKPMVAQLDPVWFTTLRYALATLPLLVLVQVWGRAPWTQLRRHHRSLAWLGLVGYGAFSTLCFYGLRLTLPSHASVLMATMPFSTLGLRWWLDGQRPSARALAGAALALAGVATVAGLLGPAAQSAGPDALWGDALIFAATLGWVIYTRGGARLSHLNALEYTALTATASLPWLLAGALLLTALGLCRAPAPVTLQAWAPSLLYVALVPTVLAVLAFNLGVRRLGPAVGTLFLNVVPVSVMAMRALLGQPPGASELLGTALVAMAPTLHALPGASAPAPRAAPCR